MSKKLFVGGLNWETSDAVLRDAFARFGEVEEAAVMVDRQTGQSRGIGFVTFVDEKAADEAMFSLHRTILDGHAIRVSVAEHQDRSDRR